MLLLPSPLGVLLSSHYFRKRADDHFVLLDDGFVLISADDPIPLAHIRQSFVSLVEGRAIVK